MTWNERIGSDPDLEPDADTTEEMLKIAESQGPEEEIRDERNRKIWETYAQYVTADGQLYGRPDTT